MKTALFILIVAGAAMPVFAQDFVAPIRRAPAPREARVSPAPPTEGALQRGFRRGNPLQLLNPFAPREYGSGRDFVSPERDPFQHPYGAVSRPMGIRLVNAEF